MRIAKNISFPNPRGPVAATHTQLLEQGHEVRCLICTLHFFVTLKMFLHASLSESAKEKFKCFLSHTIKWTLWCPKKTHLLKTDN